MSNKREAVIVAYGRSAVCRGRKGSFVTTHPFEYAAQVLNGVLARVPKLNPNDVGDLILGCAQQINEMRMNPARLIAQRAGLSNEVCGMSINRFCSSSLQAIATCANTIIAGEEDIMIAGGCEDMSKTYIPYEEMYYNQWLDEHIPGSYMGMGITAENVVERYKITREQMDRLAVESHAKAAAAQENGYLAPSIIPVTITGPDGKEMVVTQDEGIRKGTNMETLASLKPTFKEGGKVTAATSSQISDAAAFVVLMSADKAKELEIKPLAKFIGFNIAGCEPEYMGLGPIYAVPKLMKRTGLTVDDMDTIELNEAFAAQVIPCINELKLDKKKVNPWGNAMALGHPLGATGAILTCKALDFLNRYNKKYALVTMCMQGGMGAAGIFQKL
jgi:acetyl-CoA acyltransferase